MNTPKIKRALDKLNWLYRSFEEQNFENLSKLETDLFREQLKLIYAEFDIEGNDLPPVTVNIQDEVVKIKPEEPQTEKPTSNFTKAENKEILEPEEEEEEEEEIFKPNWLDSNAINKTEEPALEKNEQNKAEENKDKSDSTIHLISQGKPVNLKQIIDLNKSFILIAELFNDDNNAYNAVIEQFNKTETEEEANTLLSKLAEEHAWDNESKAYQLLERAIEKRFAQ